LSAALPLGCGKAIQSTENPPAGSPPVARYAAGEGLPVRQASWQESADALPPVSSQTLHEVLAVPTDRPKYFEAGPGEVQVSYDPLEHRTTVVGSWVGANTVMEVSNNGYDRGDQANSSIDRITPPGLPPYLDRGRPSRDY
jgi:hypothetical protein